MHNAAQKIIGEKDFDLTRDIFEIMSVNLSF